MSGDSAAVAMVVVDRSDRRNRRAAVGSAMGVGAELAPAWSPRLIGEREVRFACQYRR